MYRKILLTLTLALGLALTSTLASAQMPMAEMPADMVAALEKEKPLTQADIDAYLKVLPKMGSVMNNPDGMGSLAKEAGFSDVRFSYVSGRVGFAMSQAAGATAQQMDLSQVPQALRPTDAEIELVKKNLDALQKASMEMFTNMQKAQ